MPLRRLNLICYMVYQVRRMLDKVSGAGHASGQGLIEYGLIVILIAIAVLLTLGLFGGQINQMYQTIKNSIFP